MKKLVVMAACAIFSLAASAQRASSSDSQFFSTEKADQKITFGVRAGVNFAGLSGDDMDDVDGRTAFQVGVSVDIPILQSLYVQTGLYYSQKGWKSSFTEEDAIKYYDSNSSSYIDATYKTKGTPSYLQIPILASYRYNFSDKAQLQFNVGPYIAYGIGGKIKESVSFGGEDWNDLSAEEKTDCAEQYNDRYSDELVNTDYFDTDAFKKFDLGWQVGLGFTYNKIYAGIAYERSFTNIVDGDGKAYNTNFSISVGYNF